MKTYKAKIKAYVELTATVKEYENGEIEIIDMEDIEEIEEFDNVRKID